tara:strand:- start:625 stop:1083 length:459 start_codon:yes stop_codon:yes gene_type:complete
MSYYGFDVQSYIFTTLGNSSALQSVLGTGGSSGSSDNKIYDSIALQGAEYPFVNIGEEQTVDDSNASNSGQIVTVPIIMNSQYQGQKECKAGMKAIYDAFHQTTINASTLTSGSEAYVALVFVRSTNIQTLSDGITRIGTLNVDFITQAVIS